MQVYVVVKEFSLASCYDQLGVYYIEKDNVLGIFTDKRKAVEFINSINTNEYIQYKPESEVTRQAVDRLKIYNGIGDSYFIVVKEMEIQ